eukprot:CAMPEP_0115419006 /NCGR_PEP_ID=MMETSP0271-20121206/24964_1 /TAXON_ID=71861 /ORGANISM="Scrippsiella trochoidea, Strain CCMP3099" /LENGTH=212 /DNA_ID=CAMNT_0002843505 /DNA_START=379 /DNA_END=1014 /DNA_ORIENTATION=+
MAACKAAVEALPQDLRDDGPSRAMPELAFQWRLPTMLFLHSCSECIVHAAVRPLVDLVAPTSSAPGIRSANCNCKASSTSSDAKLIYPFETSASEHCNAASPAAGSSAVDLDDVEACSETRLGGVKAIPFCAFADGGGGAGTLCEPPSEVARALRGAVEAGGLQGCDAFPPPLSQPPPKLLRPPNGGGLRGWWDTLAPPMEALARLSFSFLA